MRFQYSEYLRPDGTKLFRPMVPILLKNKSQFIQTRGLIDSGADFTILPIEIAGALDIKLDPKKKTTFYGAGSNPFTVYHSPVSIKHMLRQGGFRTISWKAKVVFAEKQEIILLGQKGFLEKLKITLDGKRKEVEIMA